jgi:hypothetical protein
MSKDIGVITPYALQVKYFIFFYFKFVSLYFIFNKLFRINR